MAGGAARHRWPGIVRAVSAADTERQNRLVEALLQPQAYAHPVDRVEHIETHISHIFLAGDYAYKIKKAVQFAFLDYRRLEQRHRMCQREYQRNLRAAPELYLDVVPVTEASDGRIRIDGEGSVVEWAVKMRRFASDALMSTMVEEDRLTASHIDVLARRIARFHDDAPVAAAGDTHGGGSQGAAEWRSTLEELAERDDLFAPQDLARLKRLSEKAIEENAALLDRRLEADQVRHVHGDLHLRNACWLDGEPVLFDSIEFNDRLAVIDTLYDLAFLLMDLIARDHRDLANVALNSYLAERWDVEGLTLLPLFMSARAGILAKVLAEQHAEGAGEPAQLAARARHYFGLALQLIDRAPGAVVAIGGLSGTGKSTVARGLAPLLDPAPGAVLLRSDVIRKQLAGVPVTEPLAQHYYSADYNRRVYERMHKLAGDVAAAAHSVITDAVYSAPGERDDIAHIAAGADRSFHGVWLEADLETRLGRVDHRAADASDADTGVVKLQQDKDVGAIDWRRIDAGGAAETVVAAVAALR